MNNQNTFIRNLYAPGFSFVTYSFYKTNLSVRFTPWNNQDRNGRSQYDAKRAVSTTISDESAASLYYLATKIIREEIKDPVQYCIPCNNQTSLRFEYEADKAIFCIDKAGEEIPFEFAVQQYRVKENGRIINKTIQAGLVVWTEILQAYLIAVGADRQQELQYYDVGSDVSQDGSSVWR